MSLPDIFILTEAAAMVPLVRKILVDTRAERSRLHMLNRRLSMRTLTPQIKAELLAESAECRRSLASLAAEADGLNILVTPGLRCEALFPFEHLSTEPDGDGEKRLAFFVYRDCRPTISEWFFDGWPDVRRPIPADWWGTFRSRLGRLEVRSVAY